LPACPDHEEVTDFSGHPFLDDPEKVILVSGEFIHERKEEMVQLVAA
jgi:ABC-type nitrate/sulfonate/bicarbonate transport system substrate-binding protein